MESRSAHNANENAHRYNPTQECDKNLTPFFFLPFALFGTISQRKE